MFLSEKRKTEKHIFLWDEKNSIVICQLFSQDYEKLLLVPPLYFLVLAFGYLGFWVLKLNNQEGVECQGVVSSVGKMQG